MAVFPDLPPEDILPYEKNSQSEKAKKEYEKMLSSSGRFMRFLHGDRRRKL